jgi:ABC-2 type transport system permease protein
MIFDQLNMPVIKRLVVKDWQLFEKQFAAYVLAGIFSLCLIGMATKWSFYLGSLLLIIIMVAIACFSISNAMINERKERTLAFVMSLPISPLDFYLAKILGNLLTFAVPMLVLALGTIGLCLFTALPDGLIVFALLLFGQICLAFCFSLSVSMAVESEGWNIFVMIASMVLINPFIMLLGQIPAITEPAKTDAIVLSWQALSIFGVQALLSVLILICTGWFHCRKRAFF